MTLVPILLEQMKMVSICQNELLYKNRSNLEILVEFICLFLNHCYCYWPDYPEDYLARNIYGTTN